MERRIDHSPRSNAATKDQYPVCTFLSSLPQPDLHSTPYRASVPSFSDQKLKFNAEMRKIQFRTRSFFPSAGSYGSEGHMCNGWVRHVRGVYDSARRLCLIYPSLQLSFWKLGEETDVSSGMLNPLIVDFDQANTLRAVQRKIRVARAIFRKRTL